MLKNIHEVLDFYRAISSSSGGFPAPLLEPRAHLLDCQFSGLGLPSSYSDFVRRYKIENVSLGMLDLTPIPSASLREMIEYMNGSGRNPHVPDGLLHVASYEADPALLVKSSDNHKDGRVLLLDISSGLFPPPVCLSGSFEDFIVTAANLDKIIIEDRAAGRDEFVSIVQRLNPDLPEDGKQSWDFLYVTST